MVAKLFLCGVAAAAAFQAPMMAPTQHQAARTATPQMGATIRELRDRVGSVKNTKKITSAMKLVAAAKVRRAQEAVLRSRPFSETLERILGGLLQRLKTESLDIPLLETRTAKKVGLVVITGDRGLCGATTRRPSRRLSCASASSSPRASRLSSSPLATRASPTSRSPPARRLPRCAR